MTVTLAPLTIASLAAFCSTLALWGKSHRKQTDRIGELENELTGTRSELETMGLDRDVQAEEAHKKRDELAILSELAPALGASTSVAETHKVVISMVRRWWIPHHTCLVFIVDPNGSLELLPHDAKTEPDLHHPLIRQTLADMKPRVIGTVGENPVLPEEQSALLVPLRLRNELIGLIYLGSLRRDTHQAEHLEKMKTLASLAASSFKTAMLFGKQAELLDSERHTRAAVEAKNQQLDGLQKLGATIGTSLDLTETLHSVSDNLKRMISGCQSVIFLVEDDAGLLKVEFADSPYRDFLSRLTLRPDEGLLGRANNCEEALLIEDTRRQEGHTLLNKERCAIVAALRAEGKTLGFLYLGALQENQFGEEQRQLATTVAYQTSLAVNNARLYAKTQQMASTDGLTGLYLHRYFQVRLADELALAEKNRKSLCLVMVDTDNFKTYNDTLGHPAGDSLLKEIAALLKEKVRHSDVVCRIGGDEFAVILKDVPKEIAAQTCERIRETFQLRFARGAVQVTASIGLACYPADARTKAALTEVADQALYVSKRGGRNRVSLAPALGN